ncbi:flagellar export protein FliJ [Thauera sp. ZXT1-4]|uniref:flagellar export protein FliJ n=1 Tax=Thauera sp. ZXT1-4 TaxID=3460294 RepID=UPI004040948D
MTAQFHLQPLLDLANTRTDEAARRLGELVAAERDQAQKLEMLETYRKEYNERFVQAARDGMSPDAWRNFSAFMGRLDEAIAAQRKLVEQSQARTVEGQQTWIAQHTRLKAFDTLSQRHRSALDQAESRREQKQADEHAARRRFDSGSDDEGEGES